MDLENLSKTMANAINELAKLPGIGKRTATSFGNVFNKARSSIYQKLSESIALLSINLFLCRQCHNVSDAEYVISALIWLATLPYYVGTNIQDLMS